MRKILFLLLATASAQAYQLGQVFNPFTGKPDYINISSGTSGSSTTITATAVPFGSASNGVATDSATFTFDNTNKILKAPTANFSSTNMNLQLIPGAGTGTSGYLWMQTNSGFASKFEMDYSQLNDGTTSFDLLWSNSTGSGNVNGWDFQDATKTTQFSIAKTGALNNSAFNTTSSSVSITAVGGVTVVSSSAGQYGLTEGAVGTFVSSNTSVDAMYANSSSHTFIMNNNSNGDFVITGTSTTNTSGDAVNWCGGSILGSLCDSGVPASPTSIASATQYYVAAYTGAKAIGGSSNLLVTPSTVTLVSVYTETQVNVSSTVLAGSFFDISTSTTSSGIFGLLSKTIAQLRTAVPYFTGQIYYCSDCTATTEVVSTSTVVGAWATTTSKTTFPN